MNIRDNYINTLKGEKHDWVPLELLGFGFLYNKDEIEKIDDPGKREIAERVYSKLHYVIDYEKQLGYQQQLGGKKKVTNRYMVTPPQYIKEVKCETTDKKERKIFEIDTPKGKLTFIREQNIITNTSWVEKYPIETMEDIKKIRSVPWVFPEGLEPIDMSKLPDDFYERGLTAHGASAPFVCVSSTMPYDMFLELCATEFNLIKEMTRQCHERIMEVLKYVLNNNDITKSSSGGSEQLTPPMGSPKLYDELVQPFEKERIALIHKAGALSEVHCHGNVRTTLEKVIESGADYYQPVEPPPDGDIAFDEAKRIAAGRITLGGNIEARIVDTGSPEEVEEVCRRAFEGGKQRMIYRNTAQPIGRLTEKSLANLHRMIDVWEELSGID